MLNKGISTPIAIGIILILVILVGSFTYWQYDKIEKERNELPELEFPEKEEIKESVEEVAFIKDGDIWVISKDLKKKDKLIDTEKDIVYFDISPESEEFYWHNGEEIWKRDVKGLNHLLAKADKIDTEAIKELWKDVDWVDPKEIEKLKGGISIFYLSPNGEYIIFGQIEDYTSCCAGPPNIPVNGFFIIKNDGTGKTKIERPPQALEWRQMMGFWLWSSEDKFIFSLRAPDESFGSFYEIGIDGKITDGLPSEKCYSLDKSKKVYLEEQEKIKLEDIKTGEIKTILESGSLPLPYVWFGLVSEIVSWSKDGKFLLVRESNKIYFFDKEGNKINESNLSPNFINEAVISPNNKYIAGAYINKENEGVFLVDILTKEIKELELSKNQVSSVLFSNENILYYLMEAEESEYQLWVVDPDDWRKNKLLDDVTNIVAIP